MFWLRAVIFKWLFSDFVENLYQANNEWHKKVWDDVKHSNDTQREFSVFMQEMRECNRKEAQKGDYQERRHNELVEAIKSLKTVEVQLNG